MQALQDMGLDMVGRVRCPLAACRCGTTAQSSPEQQTSWKATTHSVTSVLSAEHFRPVHSGAHGLSVGSPQSLSTAAPLVRPVLKASSATAWGLLVGGGGGEGEGAGLGLGTGSGLGEGSGLGDGDGTGLGTNGDGLGSAGGSSGSSGNRHDETKPVGLGPRLLSSFMCQGHMPHTRTHKGKLRKPRRRQTKLCRMPHRSGRAAGQAAMRPHLLPPPQAWWHCPALRPQGSRQARAMWWQWWAAGCWPLLQRAWWYCSQSRRHRLRRPPARRPAAQRLRSGRRRRPRRPAPPAPASWMAGCVLR